MPIPSSVCALASHPREYHVLSGLSYFLSTYEFRPLKLSWAARQLGVSRASIGRAIQRLRAQGYVETRLTEDGGRVYRLTAKAAA